MGNRVVEACWIGFGLVWLTASFSANKTAYRQSLAEKMRWEVPFVLAAILLWKAAREPYPLSALSSRTTRPRPSSAPCSASAASPSRCGRG